ncbi:MAG: DUF1697 domain-containing protein [Luteitalea sp.]|nr:DUF1697 domain-containing protein [Luteitalea sp.]
MSSWIAFLRGINVGGNHMLPMKELAALLGKQGLTDVRTYIQSGNVVFRSAKANAPTLEKQIGNAVLKSHGFQPRVLVLRVAELERAARSNPFPQADANPKALHLFFLASKPSSPNLGALRELKAGGEAFELIDKVFYLYTPDGFGTSKLAERAVRHLGVEATARNWRTVGKVLEMAKLLG